MNNIMKIVLKRNVLKKTDKNGEDGREALGMGNCSINI